MTVLTPEFLQTKKYKALRDRLVLAHGAQIQPGVWDANDYKVVQRGAGANMTVDVGAGFALAPANDPGNAGLYHVQNDAVVNVGPFSAAHATLPRVDRVVLTVNDSIDGGDASDAGVLQIIAGTATSGATLDNLTGATALTSNSSLLLADVLIPAASSSVVTANIRDRRSWARGASKLMATVGATQTVSTGSNQTLTDLTHRLEFTGVPVQAVLSIDMEHATANGASSITLSRNASNITSQSTRFPVAGQNVSYLYVWNFTPAAGTALMALNVANAAGASTLSIRRDVRPYQLSVNEIIRPDANNGTS